MGTLNFLISKVKARIIATLVSFIYVLVFVCIEHYKQGVVTHYLLANENLPGFSNWWGLLTVPLVAWIVSSMVHIRMSRKAKVEKSAQSNLEGSIKHFFLALLFGIAVSLLWEMGFENILQFFILLPLVFSLFTVVHRPEYLLGFVYGMIYSFGGILPIIIGLVLLFIGFLINGMVRLLKSLTKSLSS